MTLQEVSKTVRNFMFDWPFYGHLLMKLRKQLTDKLPTAAVGINPDSLSVDLFINPEFWGGLPENQRMGVLHHEILHVAFGHLMMSDVFPNQKLANIAMDLEINQYVDLNNLPDFVLSITKSPFKELNLAEKKGSKFYYDVLSQEIDKDPELMQKLMDALAKGAGNHENWQGERDKMTQQEQVIFDSQQDYDMKEAVNDTGGPKNMGNMPGGIRRRIDDLFEEKPEVFNWKAYFRKFMGTIMDIQRKKTPKRESKRFAGLPGLKTKKKVKVFVSIDVSGSVSMKELADVFEQIHYVWKAGAVIDVVTWDTIIHDRFEYNGKLPDFVSGGGGSYLGIAIKEYNAKKKDYTAAIHFTDGHVHNDIPLYGRHLFIITSEGTMFDPSNGVNNYKMIQIPPDNSKK